MSEAKTFDLESVYDEKIFPLMDEIIKVCKQHHLPMFATFMYRSDPEGMDDGEDGYCTTNLTFDDNQQSDEMERLAPTLQPRRRRTVLTVKGPDGKITDQTVILD